MSEYTDAVDALNPLFYYKLDESAGTATYVNSGSCAPAGNLTTNGTVNEGSQSILPGETASTCIFQAKDTFAARRGNNALYDTPTSQPLTFGVWCKPSTFRFGGMPAVGKLGMYAVSVEDGGAVRAITASDSDLSTDKDLVVPGGVYFLVVRRIPSTSRTIFVNGVNVKQDTPGGSISNNSADFEIGGQDALGNNGFWGSLQHAFVVYANLTDAQIQNLYVIGARSVAEVAGQAKAVFPFARVISATNPSGAPRRIVNNADITMYVAEDPSSTPTATVGGGISVLPHGGSEVITSTKQLSAIHGSLGVK